MEPEETLDQLTISLEQAFFIIVKAREFDEQVESTDPDSGSNPADDREVDVLEEGADNPVQQELEEALNALNVDVDLAWPRRVLILSFTEAREEASDMRDKHISEYLIGTPKLGDYLEEGLAQLGLSLEDFERENYCRTLTNRPITKLISAVRLVSKK